MNFIERIRDNLRSRKSNEEVRRDYLRQRNIDSVSEINSIKEAFADEVVDMFLQGLWPMHEDYLNAHKQGLRLKTEKYFDLLFYKYQSYERMQKCLE